MEPVMFIAACTSHKDIHSLDNNARHTTLGVVLIQVLELNGSRRLVAVTKIKLQTSPWVCVRHFNIARIAWRNLKPAADNNGGGIALISNVAFDYVTLPGARPVLRRTSRA
jgi:hypothetical protein